jgi:hypothetical protein
MRAPFGDCYENEGDNSMSMHPFMGSEGPARRKDLKKNGSVYSLRVKNEYPVVVILIDNGERGFTPI